MIHKKISKSAILSSNGTIKFATARQDDRGEDGGIYYD